MANKCHGVVFKRDENKTSNNSSKCFHILSDCMPLAVMITVSDSLRSLPNDVHVFDALFFYLCFGVWRIWGGKYVYDVLFLISGVNDVKELRSYLVVHGFLWIFHVLCVAICATHKLLWFTCSKIVCRKSKFTNDFWNAKIASDMWTSLSIWLVNVI